MGRERAKHCDDCGNFFLWNDNKDECSKGHRPRFFRTRDYLGYKRVCDDSRPPTQEELDWREKCLRRDEV